MFDIRHYLDAKGRDLFLEWLKALRNPIAKNQIIKRTNRLEAGNFGDHKFCRDGIWELRVDIGAGVSGLLHANRRRNSVAAVWQ